MKRFLAIILLAMVLCWNALAYAYPTLQLGVSNGYYNTSDDTSYATGDLFTLHAILNTTAFDPSTPYYISAALTSLDGKVRTEGDLGYFSFGGQNFNATDDMILGTPNGLATHGIYSTYYKEFSFNFNSADRATAFNVEPLSGTIPGTLTANPDGAFTYSAFQVDTSHLAEGYALHFDLYSKNADGTIATFAPFSHDAQSLSTHTITTTTTPPTTDTGTTTTTTDSATTVAAVADPGTAATPEPATMILLGIGLLGIAGLKRKTQK